MPPGGASAKVKERFSDDEKEIQEYYDRENDPGATSTTSSVPTRQLIAGPDSSCEELLADFEGVEGPDRTDGAIPKGGEVRGGAEEDSRGAGAGRRVRGVQRATRARRWAAAC